MAATHKLQITYDEATGAVACVHRCTVEVGGHRVGHAREVTLDGDPAAALMSILDANRAQLEAEATELGVDHAAALAGKTKKGTTALKVGGTLGAVGDAAAKKKGG